MIGRLCCCKNEASRSTRHRSRAKFEEERAHLKTIQEEKAAAQLEMTFEELMKELGEKVANGTSSDDETINNGRTCSLGDGSDLGGDDGGDGGGRVKLSNRRFFNLCGYIGGQSKSHASDIVRRGVVLMRQKRRRRNPEVL